MSTFYKPPVHRQATKEEIQAISDDLKYDCSADQVEALTAIVNENLASLDLIDSLNEPVPKVKYPRTPGYKPKPEERCGNAWAWRCDIHGAPSGKLAGKTLAIKDNCAVGGVPMSNGSRLLEGYVPEYDATVVSRILDAGGRILGKASCDDFCLSAMGFSSVDGYIHFPTQPEYRVGGSSGGSAVLVACGQVDMAIAADQGGSIRIPAAWTGTVGLKPTWGLVPYTGLISIEPTIDHVGPIAKSVTDCALLLEVIAGNDGLDCSRQKLDIKVPEYSKMLELDFPGKKIGVLKEGFDTCVPETKQAVLDFLTNVGKAGLEAFDVSVPLHKHGVALLLGFFSQGCQTNLQQMGTSAQFLQGFYPTSLEKAVRQGLQCSGSLLSPGVKGFTMIGEYFQRHYGNHYYCKARNLVMELTRQYEEAFKMCDVIVMPTLTHVASKFPKKSDTEASSQLDYIKQSTDQIGNTVAADMTGHPALTLPLGPLQDGLTDSIMIVGRKYDELTVLQVARALEKIIKG